MPHPDPPSAFGAGFIALDLVLGADPTAPVRGWAGGTCGNVMSILAYLGWTTYPIGRMNGDPASQRVLADMQRWGVRLEFAQCEPTAHTPIVVQEIRHRRDGETAHRFVWSCPKCGRRLPTFKPVTRQVVDLIDPALNDASVFFFDRVSRATLTLASRAAEAGALVVFEPSGRGDGALFAEATSLAHVVKYAAQRLADAGSAMDVCSNTVVEIQTLGDRGLRYRHRLRRRHPSSWIHLDAVQVPRVRDSCGAGDWCTAGLVARVGHDGVRGLRRSGASDLRDAIRYGQALAAWNCGFEGARGGMYATPRRTLDRQIQAILSGRPQPVPPAEAAANESVDLECPSCPAGASEGSSEEPQSSRTPKSASVA